MAHHEKTLKVKVLIESFYLRFDLLFQRSDIRFEFFPNLVTHKFCYFAFNIPKFITKVIDECQFFFVKNSICESHIYEVV